MEYTDLQEAVSPSERDLTAEKNRLGEGDTTLIEEPCRAEQEERLTNPHVSLSAITVTWSVAANPPDPGGILDSETRIESSPNTSTVYRPRKRASTDE